MMVGILLSSWDGPFSGATVRLQGCKAPLGNTLGSPPSVEDEHFAPSGFDEVKASKGGWGCGGGICLRNKKKHAISWMTNLQHKNQICADMYVHWTPFRGLFHSYEMILKQDLVQFATILILLGRERNHLRLLKRKTKVQAKICTTFSFFVKT